MKVINLCANSSAIQNIISEMRDVDIQADRHRFRWNLQRLGMLMAYEVSRTLNCRDTEVTTPLGTAIHPLPTDDIVLGTIFRAGLPMHQGFLDIFDKAGNAFVSAYRYYKDRECQEVGIKIEYIATPDLTGKTLIVVDPMLATGGSFELALEAFKTHGTPSKIHFCAAIAAKQGVEYLKRRFADTGITLWCAAIDPILNEHKYIVPGLGDCGDLCYGEKL